jgi:hypothetical protein
MNKWAQFLAQYQKSYREAEADVYQEIPDGQYVMKVESVRLKFSKSNRLMLEWELVVTEGPYKGRREWKFNLLDDEKRIGWLKRDLFTAGLELQEITRLEEELPQLLDRVLQVKIQTKMVNGNTYRNIYFQKCLEEKRPSASPTGIWMPEDSQYPF